MMRVNGRNGPSILHELEDEVRWRNLDEEKRKMEMEMTD